MNHPGMGYAARHCRLAVPDLPTCRNWAYPTTDARPQPIIEDSCTLRSPRNDRQWQPRRRGFDDDNFYGNTPPPVPFPSFASSSAAPEVQATVKWFNAEKGYGFAALADGSGDVF